MRWKPLVTLTVAVLVFVSAATLLSQIKARVDLVVVPVSVRDSNGFLITELEKDDFTVLEDGRRQTISNFSKDAQPLSVAIVIDDGMSGNALKRLAPLLPSVVAPFTPDDEMTSFRYDHVIWKLSEFTSDHSQIQKSFYELKEIADRRPDEPEPPALYGKIERKTPGFVKDLARIFTLGSVGAPPALPNTTATTASATSRVAPASRTMHGAVYEAVMALQGRPADHRKIILLISDGAVSEPRVSIAPGQTTVHSFEKNVSLLLKSEIQVYSVHTLVDLLEKPSGVLDSYARATGGDVYGGRSESDMKFAFNRIAEQARTQYVLGYLSNNEPPAGGIYRKIEVKSGDPDQKRKVVHRIGYTQLPTPQ
jgi:VWFA-related protein